MISLKKIEYSYNNPAGEIPFKLGPVNLEIEKGEKVSILGPNGSGKSTLLKIIAGVIKPDSGEMRIDKNSYSDYSIRDLAKKIAFVPQNTLSVYPFTVYEIVMMGRTPYLNYFGYENNSDCEIVEEALNSVDMLHLKDKSIMQISGGEVQRAFIARALAQQSEIVLLDEPNSHLDIKHQIDLFNLVNELRDSKNITFISVSHDINLAIHFFERSILLRNGEIAFDGETRNVINRDNIKSVFDVNSKIVLDAETNKLNISFLN